MDASALQLVGSNVTVGGTNVIQSGRVVRTGMPAGAVLQVVQTVKTSIFSMSSLSWTAVTGYSATITPTSSTSKILVMFSHSQTTDYNGGTGWYSSHAACIS